MAVLPYDQLYAVMDGAFGDLGPDVVALMTAIAMAESGGNTAAHNNKGEDSRGIGQVNIGPGANTDLAGFDLFDPEQNAKAMRIVYDRQGPGAWSVYSNGAYQNFLDMFGGAAVPLVQQAADPSRVMAPKQETKSEAVPLIDPAADWNRQMEALQATWPTLGPIMARTTRNFTSPFWKTTEGMMNAGLLPKFVTPEMVSQAQSVPLVRGL